jgi:two-component system, NtrC family, response regulator AtoC
MRDSPLQLLLVDDDPVSTEVLRARLEASGTVEVRQVESGQEALHWLSRGSWDAVVSDVMMPEMDGIQLVGKIRAYDPSLPVFLITGRATVRRAVEGIRAGATDFLPKPVDVDALLALLERAVAERPVREELSHRVLRREGAALEDYLVASHPRLKEVGRNVERIARLPRARVLLTGESGTGKSVLARAIHDLSGASGRIITVNCAALPAHLLESELFGHEKGAFTDAQSLKRGLIELARHGTVFLDEIGAMPLELQGKLLLFLEDRQIRRVGGTDSIPVEAHVIAATNEDLQARVADRTFRADLLYRLDVASIHMPPLREMPSVIPELAGHFARELAAESRLPLPDLDEESFRRLEAYPWPGNARELRNAVERALIYHESGPLRVSPPAEATSIWPEAEGSGLVLPLDLPLKEVERRYLEAQLEAREEMDLQEVASALGISRKTLWEKRKRFRLA